MARILQRPSRSYGRRIALGTLAALAAHCVVPGPLPHPIMNQPQPSARMPAIFLPHGGGPWPFIDETVFGAAGMWTNMRHYMDHLAAVPPRQPRAVLVISAHWEEPTFTVQSAREPSLLYDYYGFPAEAYQLKWPAPGTPEVAAEVCQLLQDAGLSIAQEPSRGFDHGVFVPLKLAYPDANVPVLQLSLKAGLDPREHLAAGQALAPLRDRGIVIVGSGMSYHNMREFGAHMRGRANSIASDSKAFDDWLVEAMSSEASHRHAQLIDWERAPAARACHPREEHLLPLMVVAGSALDDPARAPYRDTVMGAHVSAIHFG